MSKKYFSRKYLKLLTLESLLEVLNDSDDSKNDKLMIHTANGIYIGTLVLDAPNDGSENKQYSSILNSFEKAYLSNLENYENENENQDEDIIILEENPISITLKDVEIITSGKNINMPFAIIFIDQIIGFSLGHI